MTAVNEVEAALAGLEAGRRRHSLLVSLTEEAGAEADLQERRYLSGVGEYETWLAAAQVHLGAQSVQAGGGARSGFLPSRAAPGPGRGVDRRRREGCPTE